MSLMEMEMMSVEGDVALAFGSENITLDQKSAARLAAAGKTNLLVGVRPDKASVSLEPVPKGIQCEIYSRQLLGADVLVEVEVGKSRVRAKADTSFGGNVGTPCYLNFQSENLYFFDAEDGKVIPQ